jgi:hypothetical protein
MRQSVAWSATCCVAGAVSGKVRACIERMSFAPAADLGRGLTLRCTPTRYGWLRQPARAGEVQTLGRQHDGALLCFPPKKR